MEVERDSDSQKYLLKGKGGFERLTLPHTNQGDMWPSLAVCKCDPGAQELRKKGLIQACLGSLVRPDLKNRSVASEGGLENG